MCETCEWELSEIGTYGVCPLYDEDSEDIRDCE